MKNKPVIKNLEDLRREKMLLRGEIVEKELVLKSHYASIKEKIQPVLNITKFLSGNKLLGFFKGNTNEEDTGNNFNSIIKVVLAAAAVGLVLKNSRKLFFKSIFAYALSQGEKFILEKDLGEHIENIKSWIAKFRPQAESDEEGIND